MGLIAPSEWHIAPPKVLALGVSPTEPLTLLMSADTIHMRRSGQAPVREMAIHLKPVSAKTLPEHGVANG